MTYEIIPNGVVPRLRLQNSHNLYILYHLFGIHVSTFNLTFR